MKNAVLTFVLAALVGLGGSGRAAEAKADLKPYPLTKCVLMNAKVDLTDKKPIAAVNGDQELRFCCQRCLATYKQDPQAYMQKLEKAVQQAAKDHPYKLETCLVTGEKFGGDMGKPYVFVYADQEIKLCCKGCLAEFKKDPAKYLKKIETAKAGK